MKKLLALICLLTLTGCGGGDVEVQPFSYEETISFYKNPDIGISDNFKNTAKKEIIDADDAIKRAKNEGADDYNAIEISYDETADIWRVRFYKENTVGGTTDVYLNGDGITQRVIYGE